MKDSTQVTHIDVWFDREQFKCWIITQYDAEGNQTEDSDFSAHKKDAVAFAKELIGDSEITLSVSKRDGSY